MEQRWSIWPLSAYFWIWLGFTLIFWKGDFFSPRVFAGSGPPPPDFLETRPES